MEDPLGLVGLKIDDKYQIDSVVGEGGFAIVYKATHLLFKRAVAIKAFRTLSDFGPDARDQLVQEFLQEARLLAELSERSAAIVQARDIGTLTTPKGEWIPYMVLEWLDGMTLEAVLEGERTTGKAPRNIEQVISLMDPVAEALALAHRKGVAHRDIKPANVFILSGGERAENPIVKLLDFGIAKVVQDVQKTGGSFQKTKGHVTSFTPTYGAPEQFSRTHGSTGPWTDVFALGLVVTEMLTQKIPLDGESFIQLGFASADPNHRPTPRSMGASVSDAVEAVIARAVAVGPEQRFQSAGEMWMALREAAMMPTRSSVFDGGLSAPLSAPLSGRSVAPPSGLPHSVTAPAPMPVPPNPTSGRITDPQPLSTTAPRASGSSKAGVFIAAGAALLAVAAAAVVLVGRNHDKDRDARANPSAQPSVAVSVAPSKPHCDEGQVLIEGGEFFMGSSDNKALDNEKPTHSVTLSSYCIDKTEVTVTAYLACSKIGKCAPASKTNAFADLDDSLRKVIDPLCNVNDPSGKATHPINCVDWDMASNYCKRQGGKLPTEAEWEFAARGPDGRAYPWGDEEPASKYLNGCGKECDAWGKKNHVENKVTFGMMYDGDDGYPNTSPVGSFPAGASRYGLEDVVGNVWEWTGDFFAPYTKDAVKDPTGALSSEDGRVARGGAWNGPFPSWVRPTFRFHFNAENRSYGVGFRCAEPVKL